MRLRESIPQYKTYNWEQIQGYLRVQPTNTKLMIAFKTLTGWVPTSKNTKTTDVSEMQILLALRSIQTKREFKKEKAKKNGTW